jgi:hypothetical protein
MIDHFQRKVDMDRTTRPSEARDSAPEPQAFLEAQRLFPFPRTLCDNMDLLEPSAVADDLFSLNDLDFMSNDAIFDFTWLDSLGMDFGDGNMDLSGDT